MKKHSILFLGILYKMHSTFFNFGDSIKSWIFTFYNDIKSCVISNGIASSYFYPERGCAQGELIYPIFIPLVCRNTRNFNSKTLKGLLLKEKNTNCYIILTTKLFLLMVPKFLWTHYKDPWQLCHILRVKNKFVINKKIS